MQKFNGKLTIRNGIWIERNLVLREVISNLTRALLAVLFGMLTVYCVGTEIVFPRLVNNINDVINKLFTFTYTGCGDFA